MPSANTVLSLIVASRRPRATGAAADAIAVRSASNDGGAITRATALSCTTDGLARMARSAVSASRTAALSDRRAAMRAVAAQYAGCVGHARAARCTSGNVSRSVGVAAAWPKDVRATAAESTEALPDCARSVPAESTPAENAAAQCETHHHTLRVTRRRVTVD